MKITMSNAKNAVFYGMRKSSKLGDISVVTSGNIHTVTSSKGASASFEEKTKDNGYNDRYLVRLK